MNQTKKEVFIEVEKEKLLEEKIAEAKTKEKTSQLSMIPIRRLNDLDDVNITSPSNNQQLKYNSTSGKWENFTP